MARITIASLSSELAALREHCARREAAWESATADVTALKAEVAALKARGGNDNGWHVKRTPATEPVISEARSLMQQARELSMRTRRAHVVRNGEIVAC